MSINGNSIGGEKKHVLLCLFPADDLQASFLITSCIALRFAITTALTVSAIEELIKVRHYEIVIVDTRSHTRHTVLNLLRLLNTHVWNSYIIAVCSSQSGVDTQSKIDFLLALLKSGIDRILEDASHVLCSFSQLLFIAEVDLRKQRQLVLASQFSTIIDHLPQPIEIVNEQLDILYRNVMAMKNPTSDGRARGNILDNFGGRESSLGKHLVQQLSQTTGPWVWKPTKTSPMSITFIPLSAYSSESKSSRSSTTSNDRRSRSIGSRLSNKILSEYHPNPTLNDRSIELLRNARTDAEIQLAIGKIASELNIQKEITTINDLIEVFGENNLDLTTLGYLNTFILKNRIDYASPNDEDNENLIGMIDNGIFLQRNLDSLSIEIRQHLSLWNSWNFDLIRLESMLGSMTLFYTAMQIFLHFQVHKTLKCSNEILINWLAMVSRNYYNQPYHNATHGTDVLQAASFYLLHSRCFFIFNELEIAAILISCLCHDIQHPGRTNTHLTNKHDPLALLYNDQAILENHHASATFRLTMNSASVNIFAQLSEKDFVYIRSQIIDSILVTDVSKHFEYVQTFAIRNKNEDRILIEMIEQNRFLRRGTLLFKGNDRSSFHLDPTKTKEQISKSATDAKKIDHFKTNVRRMIMKNADLSNSTRPNHIAYTWATRIAEELFCQTEIEKENNLILTIDVFTRETCNLARTQIVFYDLFINEMLKEWIQFTELNILEQHFHHNYAYWKDIETFEQQQQQQKD